MKIAIVAPHIFMQDRLLNRVIFSPGRLAIDLANELQAMGEQVTLFSPGPITTTSKNQTADLSLLQAELKLRGDDELSLLKKHPLTFVSLARQIQAELLATAFDQANQGKFDVVHVYMNEEELGLAFNRLCNKPVVFTHHDPFNFSTKYRSLMPQYTQANWLSMSLAQRQAMPSDTNWVSNIYHGLPETKFKPLAKPTSDYFAYIGRIIEPKGVHLAIAAVKQYNHQNQTKLKLKIAGKHYSGTKDKYWQQIEAQLGDDIEYVGFLNDDRSINKFLGNARGLIIPSIFDEPFGMVMIEALACGTPIIGLDSGAIPEVIKNGQTGWLVNKQLDGDELDQDQTINNLIEALAKISQLDRSACRQDFEARFTISRMAKDHLAAYQKLVS